MLKAIRKKINKFFFTGLLVTLPLAITVYFSIFLFNSIDKILGPAVTGLLIKFGAPIKPTYRIPGLGLIITLAIVFLSGVLVTNFIGKKIVSIGESIVDKIPVIRNIYSTVKQIIETLYTANSATFKKVVMLEFPMKEVYTIGFISSETYEKIQELTKDEMINVFVPTIPNITTGFFLIVPQNKLIPLPLTVEEGMKMAISGGIVAPKSEKFS